MAIDLYDGSDIIYTLLTDLGIKMDTNNTTENSSKDLDERYVDKPFIPQVRTNTLSDDVDNTMTSIENAKYASFEFLDLKTDQDTEVYYYNYRSQKEEPKEVFTENRVYHSPIETQIYTKAEEEASESINVVDNVKENPVDKVTENVVDSVSGQSGAPATYQSKSPWSPAFKNYAFSITTIDKVADFVQEFNRQDELTDEQTNKFVNHLPVTEVNKDYRDDLKEKAKQTGKVITFIPKSLNYPYIEDEMAGNKLFYGDMDWMEMSDLSEM